MPTNPPRTPAFKRGPLLRHLSFMRYSSIAALVLVAAGLHTGDRVVSINGQAIANRRDVRATLAPARIGDSVVVQVQRPNGPFRASVPVVGFTYPRVRLEERADATAAQRQRRQRWITASP